MTYFTLGEANRTLRDWALTASSAHRAASNYARANGAAGLWRADGALVLYYRDGDSVRRRTFAQAAPRRAR